MGSTLELVRHEASKGRQYSLTKFCREFSGKDGKLEVAEKALRVILRAMVDDNWLVMAQPDPPQRNVTEVLAVKQKS